MSRKKRWEEDSIKNGVGEVHIYSWRYFIDYVRQEMLDYRSETLHSGYTSIGNDS